MLKILGIAISTLALISNGSLAQDSDDLEIPDAWETCYLVLISANPASPEFGAERRAELMRGHITYQLRLARNGQSVAAGGVGEGLRAELRGLTILRANTLVDASAIANGDPAVAAGLFQVDVREWYIPSPGICASGS